LNALGLVRRGLLRLYAADLPGRQAPIVTALCSSGEPFGIAATPWFLGWKSSQWFVLRV
jgi:hypothetical protein